MGGIDLIATTRGLEEEDHCEIPKTWEGHKKKKNNLKKGTTSKGPKKEEDHMKYQQHEGQKKKKINLERWATSRN